MSRCAPGGKVYVGNLDVSASEADIEQAFAGHGKILKIWIARNPPGFAFVEYDDPRDAKEAVEKLNGASVRGKPVRVELSNRADRVSRPKENDRDVRDSQGRHDRSRQRSRSRTPPIRRDRSPNQRTSTSRPARRSSRSPRRRGNNDYNDSKDVRSPVRRDRSPHDSRRDVRDRGGRSRSPQRRSRSPRRRDVRDTSVSDRTAQTSVTSE